MMTPAALKTLRLGSGLTQGGLALLLGVNVRSVQRWEAGERRIGPLAASAIGSACWGHTATKLALGKD